MTIPPLNLPPQAGTEQFFLGPGETLIGALIARIRAATIQGAQPYDEIFGDDRILDYMKEDLDTLAPTMMVYEGTEKFKADKLVGELEILMVLPPEYVNPLAIRLLRAMVTNLMDLIDTAHALIDQVPGLSSLGREMTSDYSKAYLTETGDLLRSATLRVSYEIDMEDWKRWLCENELRTRDPFEGSLEKLQRIVGTIDAYTSVEAAKDDETPETAVGVDTTTTEEA